MNITEDNVIERFKLHDPDALQYIMDNYGTSVLNLVKRILISTCSKEDQEECASDVFIAAWNRIEEYEDCKGTFKTWLYMLAKYKALDYRRQKLGRHQTSDLYADAVDALETEQIVLDKEQKQEIIQLINSFDEMNRSIFYRRYFWYESIESIAISMGLTYKAVENRLSRSRKILKQQLQPEIQEELL